MDFREDTNWESILQPSGRTGNIVRTLFSVPKDSSFPLLMRKGITAMIVRTLEQHVRTGSWYGKLSALFWKGSCCWPSGLSVKPLGHPSLFGGFWTRLSIFIITFFSSIGLRQNWCRWKANKKCYKLPFGWLTETSGQKDQASGCSPEFEKFWNFFSNTETIDRPNEDCHPDARARDSDSN